MDLADPSDTPTVVPEPFAAPPDAGPGRPAADPSTCRPGEGTSPALPAPTPPRAGLLGSVRGGRERRRETNPTPAEPETGAVLMRLGSAHRGGRPSRRRSGPSFPLPPGFHPVGRVSDARGPLGRGACEVWSASGPGGVRVELTAGPAPGTGAAGEGSGEHDLTSAALEALRSARHPNVLGLVGAWSIDGWLVLATEPSGPALGDWLATEHAADRPGLSRDELTEALAEAAKALDFLNAQAPGRPHAAVHPGSLRLVGGGVKIALPEGWLWPDDGPPPLARPFAAPEALDGCPGPRSDQYSLAAVYGHLRAVAAGREPADTPGLEDLGPSERPALARAMSASPDSRWPSCRAFVEALRADNRTADALALLASPDPFADAPASTRPHDGRRLVPRRTALALATATGILAIAATVLVDRGLERSRALSTPPLVAEGLAPAHLRLQDDAVETGRDTHPHPTPAPPAPRPESPPLRPEASERDEPPEILGDADPPRASTPPRVRLTLSPAVVEAGDPAGVAVDLPGRGAADSAELTVLAPPGSGLSPETYLLGPGETSLTLGQTRASSDAAPVAVRVPVLARAGTLKAEADLTLVLGTPALPQAPPAPAAAAEVAATSPIVKPTPPEVRVTVPVAAAVVAGRSCRWPVRVEWVGDVPSGPLRVELVGLPAGIEATGARVALPPGGSTEFDLTLSAEPNAPEVVAALDAVVWSDGETSRTSATHTTLAVRPHPGGEARRRGDDLLRQEDYDGAIAAYGEALWEDPRDAQALHGRGLARYGLGDHRRAIADLDAADRVTPNDPALLNNRGLARLGAVDVAGATADFETARRLDPSFVVVRYNLGRAYAQAGDTRRAVTEYDEALRLNPAFAKAFKARADALTALGQHDRALADYNEAVRLRHDDSAALNNRGLLRLAMGEPQRAIADFDEAIRVSPRYAVLRYNRGRVYAQLGDLTEALASFDEAIRLDPGFARAYKARAEVNARRGDLTRAEADRERAARLEGPAPTPSASAPAAWAPAAAGAPTVARRSDGGQGSR